MSTKEAKHFIAALIIVFFGLFVLIVSGFLAPLVLGMLLAGLIYPLYKELSHGLGQSLGALVSTLLVMLIIILPVLGILSLLVKEAIDLLSTQRDWVSLYQPIIKTLEPISFRINFDIEAFIGDQLVPALNNLGATISSELGNLLSNALRLGLNFFVMLITVFYMLRDGKKFAEFLMDFSPLKSADELSLYGTFRDAGKAVFLGNFVSALVQGILGGIGFALFGLGSPVLWGTIMAFLALIPFRGPYLIFLPAAIYIFSTQSMAMTLGFLFYNILIVSSVDNLIKPKLIGEKIRVHPLLILVSILGGLKAFGLIGIIYGPLIVAIFLALLKVYLAHNNHEANIKPNSL